MAPWPAIARCAAAALSAPTAIAYRSAGRDVCSTLAISSAVVPCAPGSSIPRTDVTLAGEIMMLALPSAAVRVWKRSSPKAAEPAAVASKSDCEATGRLAGAAARTSEVSLDGPLPEPHADDVRAAARGPAMRIANLRGDLDMQIGRTGPLPGFPSDRTARRSLNGHERHDPSTGGRERGDCGSAFRRDP